MGEAIGAGIGALSQIGGGSGTGGSSADASIAQLKAVLDEAIAKQAEITAVKVDKGTALNAEKAGQNPTV